MRTPTTPRRIAVLVVDDNEITRSGCVRLLAGRQGIVAAGTDHDGALALGDRWTQVDVVLVDAADARRRDDQFPGVAVVEEARRRRGDDVVVIVLTGHVFDDAVRRRMREARADFLYARSAVVSGDQLVSIVLEPEADRRVPAVARPQELAALGIGERSTVNAFVAAAADPDVATALRPGGAMKQGPAGPRSRWWRQLRRRLAALGGIEPVNRDGSPPHRPQDAPSVAQLRRVHTWATRVKGSGDT